MPAGVLYRWEDNNHGLEHKCGTCKTVLSSPRAKKSCFGVHEEVCTRYHKTLFFLGHSHHCDACHKSIEQHKKRHREIFTIIQRVQHLDDVADAASPPFDKKRKARIRSSGDNPGSDPASLDALNEEDAEWNDSSTLNDDEADAKRERWTVNLETPGGKKAAKAEKKTARNQASVEFITDDDLKYVEDALHPDPIVLSDRRIRSKDKQGLSNNSTIERNITYNSHTFSWSRQGARDKKLAKAQAITLRKPISHSVQKNDVLVESIIRRLDLRPTPLTKQRKTLDAKLRAAIKADLIAYENEIAETMTRMAGYWRYVNRRTYNAMIQMNEIWDWATGEKLPEFEEIELIDEADSDGGGDGAAEEINRPEPEAHDEDGKFEIPAGESGFGPTSDIETDCEQKPATQASVFAFTFRCMADLDILPPVLNIPPKTLTYKPRRAPLRPNLASATSSLSARDAISISESHRDQATTTPTLKNRSTRPDDPPARKPTGIGKGKEKSDIFKGTKDTRIFDKAIRAASPPPSTSSSPPAAEKQITLRPRPRPRTTLGASLPSTTTPSALAPLQNSFGALEIETPAPREHVELVAPAANKASRRARRGCAGGGKSTPLRITWDRSPPLPPSAAAAAAAAVPSQNAKAENDDDAFPVLPPRMITQPLPQPQKPKVKILNILAPTVAPAAAAGVARTGANAVVKKKVPRGTKTLGAGAAAPGGTMGAAEEGGLWTAVVRKGGRGRGR